MDQENQVAENQVTETETAVEPEVQVQVQVSVQVHEDASEQRPVEEEEEEVKPPIQFVFNIDDPGGATEVEAEAEAGSAEPERKKRSLRDIVVSRRLGAAAAAQRGHSLLLHPAASIGALPVSDSGEHIAVESGTESGAPDPSPKSPKMDTKSARLLNLTLRLMAPTRARPSFSFATPRAASGSISALKSSTALTANFGSSFAMGDSGGVVNTHVQEYALPSNLHLDYKPTLAGSSVLAPDFRNGLTGRKVNNDTQLQTSAPSGTSPQNRMLPRPSTMAMRTSTILERHETSTLDLSAPHTHHRQTSITLSTMDLTPGNGNGARSSDVASFAFRTNRRGSLQMGAGTTGMSSTHRKSIDKGFEMMLPPQGSSSMLGDSLDSHNDSFNNYGKQNSTFGLGSIAGFAPQESAAVKWTRELPTNTKHGDRVADVPVLEPSSIAEIEKEMDSNTSNLATSPTAAATGGGKQYFLLEAQHKHFDSQRSKPSFIPRPASRIEQYIERVEIVPLSLVPPAESLPKLADNPAATTPDRISQTKEKDCIRIKESIEAVCVIDPFNVPYPSTQDPTSSSTTASNKLTPESKTPKLARPHTVPPGKSKPIDMTRFSKSAKPARVGGGHGSKLKAKKLEEILIDTKTGKKVTILTKQGFGTAVEKRKTISDPMEALLSTHTNNNNNKPPQKPSTAPSRIRTTETTTNGPCLPHLESRPITTYLKNRLRDPHAFNPTNIPTTTPNGTRQFQADSTISPYSQPLPITRYIPNSQKQPSKHAAKLRGLRAQHEFQIQEAYLGDTAIAPKWFMKHAQMVVEQKVQQGLMFGGCVQGLVPSFNTRKPSHVVFSTLGKVHWQEYEQAGGGGAGGGGGDGFRDGPAGTREQQQQRQRYQVQQDQDQEHGETRKMLDDLLKRHRIKRMVDETLVDASTQENRLEFRMVPTTTPSTARTTTTAKHQNPRITIQKPSSAAAAVQPVTQNIGLLNPNLNEEKKISLGGGFIYSKNKPPSKKEEDKPIQFRARKSRYLEQLFVEAFSM